MNDNTSARPVLTDDEIRSKAQAIWGMRDFGALAFARAIEQAVLSKLRAPVAGDGKTRVPGDQLGGPAVAWHDGAQSDPNRPESRANTESKGGALAPVAGESPMAKMADALREKARQEQQAYKNRHAQPTEWGPMSAGTEADDPSSLAALEDGLESIEGNENAAMAATYIRAQADRLANTSVAGEAMERIEQMAVARYRAVPCGQFSHKVIAGDGSRSLHVGPKDECLEVAAHLTEAFLDGAFVASSAAPQASEAKPAADAAVKAAYVEHFGSEAGWLSYKGSWFIEGYRAGMAAQSTKEQNDAN